MITIYLAEDIDLDDAPQIKQALEDRLGDLGIMVDRVEISRPTQGRGGASARR